MKQCLVVENRCQRGDLTTSLTVRRTFLVVARARCGICWSGVTVDLVLTTALAERRTSNESSSRYRESSSLLVPSRCLWPCWGVQVVLLVDVGFVNASVLL
jgi:hypothetical protein